jgi:cation diffusion facilitator family transporter
VTDAPDMPGRLSARGVTWLGLAVNAGLAVMKVAAGTVLRSQTLIADGLHAASDLTTDLATLLALGISHRPPDHLHPYGHRRMGTMIGFGIGLALGGAACWVFYRSMMLLGGRASQPIVAPWAVAIVAVTIPVKEILYRMTIRIGRKTNDLTVKANAWHHRSDAFTSLAATIGLAGVAIGGEDWAFLDAMTALVLSAFLLVIGVRIIGRAAAELVDRAPAEATQEAIRQVVADTAGVTTFHALRAREIGGRVAVDVHVQVDARLTVCEGHDIARAVKARVREADPAVMEVMVHIEPSSEEEQCS